MATVLKAKTASEVVKRVWTVPVDEDDAPSSVSLSASGVAVDSNSFEGNDLVLVLSAGTAAATGSIVATVTTEKSRTLIETLYVPVIESAAQVAETAGDIIDFALRKVIGNGETATANESTDALQRLQALIDEMRIGGADIGAVSPLATTTVIYCPDWAVGAIRYNLLLDVYSLYDAQPTGMDVMRAKQGMQLVKHKLLPDEREVEYY